MVQKYTYRVWPKNMLAFNANNEVLFCLFFDGPKMHFYQLTSTEDSKIGTRPNDGVVVVVGVKHPVR
jgi:hypothetical protein